MSLLSLGTDTAQAAGTGINSILSGIVSPANTLLGTTTQTSTTSTAPSDASKTKSKTTTIIISVLAGVTLLVVAVIIFKSAKKA